jgi:hypothetical protein
MYRNEALRLEAEINSNHNSWFAVIWVLDDSTKKKKYPMFFHKDGLWRIFGNSESVYFDSKEALEKALYE